MNIIKTILITAMSLVIFLIHETRECHSQINEAALVRAMQELGNNWQSLSRTADVLIMGCTNNTFKGIRLVPGAVISVDLRKTNSLMNPYLGIVHIRGHFQQNNSIQNGACFSTPAEAKQNGNWHDNNMDYDLEAYYQLNGRELLLTSGNEVFRNSFMLQSGSPQVTPNSEWLKAFKFPII